MAATNYQLFITISEYFRDQMLSLHPDMPIAWPNEQFDPPNEQYIRFTIESASSKQVSIGATTSNLFRSTGILFFQIFLPLNIGDAENLIVSDEIIAMFREVSLRVDARNSVFFTEPRLSATLIQDGYYQSNVLINYTT